MSLKVLILCTILLGLHNADSAATIREINDDDFLKMRTTNSYMIILFTREDCKPCEAMEKELVLVEAGLKESLDGTIAKIYDSSLLHLYSAAEEPVTVFFRHGVPLLYVGPVDAEFILHYFIETKEPVVKELDDDNFEYLTQATSGSTTGDWYIMFYSRVSSASRTMGATWEAVGAALRKRMNVARVLKEGPGTYTAKRFHIGSCPAFLLLHQGRMWMYTSLDRDVPSLLNFALHFKDKEPGEEIPMPIRPANSWLRLLIEIMEENDWYVETALFGIVLGVICAIFARYMDAQEKEEDEEIANEREEEREQERERDRQKK